MFRTRPAPALAVLAAALVAAAGCSSQGGSQEERQGVDTPELTIAMITHEAPGDTFWDLVRNGAEASAAKSNVTLDYSSDPEAAKQATLIRTAIDKDVDGIAVTFAKPDALQGAIDEAAEAGIPVVGLNSGIEYWQDAGLIEFFGMEERLAGEAFGDRLNEVDAGKTLCVIHEQGNVGLEERCEGLEESFDGDVERLNVDGANMPDVSSSITSKLQEDDEVDYVATLGAPFAMAAVDVVAETGSEATVATFDTNEEAVQAIKDGDLEWAVDQQPYLQGYMAVEGLWLYATNGNTLGGGTQPVLTGPSFIDADNVDQVAEYAANGTR
ncbi:substrate-binding domain-containing protein [Nocardiopsis composta]|uniref:Simple sugar transport system substrate-binding protein n=1 Tax=Nocardiopsis composta TaxID=157465 RepID=A0A7W8VFT2_9ACTN|nr:substrate-binding domain-containing protein [Nocardiopsis composta]MBB5434289.1 simple sugar transport system substrate-binding protein [Nocardiopsis composta]